MAFTARIAHVCHWRLPGNDTATIQLVQTASALVRAGAVVDLFLPRSPWRRAEPAEALRRRLREHYLTDCGFGIRQIPSRLLPVDWTSRALHAMLAVRATRGKNSTVVHTRDFETLLAALGLGQPVVFETYRSLTRASSTMRRVLLRLAARKRFLGVITHSRFARDQYLEDGFPPEKIRTIYNGFDPAPFAVERSPGDARRALGLVDGTTVVYMGRIAPMKRIDLLLDTAARTPDLRWILAGDRETPEARPFVERARTLPNVSLPGFLRGEPLTLTLQAADILITQPSADPLERFGRTGIPIKIFQYLAAGRAILVVDLPDTAELLIQDENCVKVPRDDAAAFLAGIRALADDPTRRERLGAAAKRGAAALTWDARAAGFLEYLEEAGSSIL